MTLSFAPASTHEFGDALPLLFGHLRPDEALERSRLGLQLLTDSAPESPTNLFTARVGHALVGAVLVQALPGGVGVLWPPCAPHRPDVEDELLHIALRWMRQHHVDLVQATLGPKDAPLAAPLRRGGFTQPTQLIFMERRSASLSQDGLCRRFDPSRLEDLQAALSACLSESLDFPELHPLRSIADVLQGFRLAGSSPDHWWLRYEGDAIVGMLMLAPQPPDAWEVTYLGVVPWARRRGHARKLLRLALGETHHAGADTLSVCVDGRNIPARHLYHTCGFRERERQDVYFYRWPT